MEELLTRKRLTREESRAQTRERILDAALAAFRTEGIESSSIEEVTEAAGYSRGAFYSNFESKDDLLCAVLEREIQRDTKEFEDVFAATPPAELISKLREVYVAMARDPGDCALWMGVQLYSLRNPEMRPRVAELLRKKRADVVSLVQRVYEAVGEEPPGSAETVALGLIAIAQGFGITLLLDPQAIPDELLPQALETLFDQITCAPAIESNCALAGDARVVTSEAV